MAEPTVKNIYPPGSFPITCQVVVSPSGFFAAPIGTNPTDIDAYRRFETLDELAKMVGVAWKPQANAAEETPRAKPRCPSCGSERWVSVSLNEGVTRLAQCVPCGAYHKGVIGPGWRSPRFNDPEAVHPDYRD